MLVAVLLLYQPDCLPFTRFSPCSTLATTAVLRDQTSVDAVEMFDRASLRECEANEDMLRLVPDIKGGWGGGGLVSAVGVALCQAGRAGPWMLKRTSLQAFGGHRLHTCISATRSWGPDMSPRPLAGADPMAASLLIECRGSSPEDLAARIEEVQTALRRSGLPFGAKAAGGWWGGAGWVVGWWTEVASWQGGGEGVRSGTVAVYFAGPALPRNCALSHFAAPCPPPAPQSRSRWRRTSSSTSPRTTRWAALVWGVLTPCLAWMTALCFLVHSHARAHYCSSPARHASCLAHPPAADLLGRASRADPHCGRRPQAGHLHAAGGRGLPRGQVRRGVRLAGARLASSPVQAAAHDMGVFRSGALVCLTAEARVAVPASRPPHLALPWSAGWAR